MFIKKNKINKKISLFVFFFLVRILDFTLVVFYKRIKKFVI